MQKTIKVYQHTNQKGRPVANHFIINENTKNKYCNTFQSYNTTICKVTTQTQINQETKTNIILDKNALNYSITTSKHLYNFLRSFTCLGVPYINPRKRILQAIKNKEIQTKNLN
tara:strand:- start:1124 stop:1465 length:342 start_codon:yes stop_codon:yes gene_type:complete